MKPDSDTKRELLRHAVATLAYRGEKSVRGTTERFAMFRVSDNSRTPSEILAHIGDLLDWALSMAKGKQAWKDSTPLPWQQEIERFFHALQQLDSYLASEESLGFPAEKLFQGPVADALTHVGQIAMLRRLAGEPMKGENYFKAEIVVGRVGPNQSTKRAEFD